jgi:hypothetical protein
LTIGPELLTVSPLLGDIGGVDDRDGEKGAPGMLWGRFNETVSAEIYG